MRAGMTQQQLADLSTVSIRAIRDQELGHARAPRKETVRLLADALQLSEVRRLKLEAAAACRLGAESLGGELPQPPTPLQPIVGRQGDVASLTELLGQSGHRLITVAGIAGVGKTRLIQEVVNSLHLANRVPVIWLSADGGGDRPSGLSGRISALLTGECAVEDIADMLADANVLLVIEGHRIGRGVESTIRALLHRCPGLRVVYETREPLPHLEGAVGHTVLPLTTPAWSPGGTDASFADYPAVQFLLSQCSRLRPETMFDPEAVSAIAGIACLLDGIPLALKTAAFGLDFYEPTQLLDIVSRSSLAFVRPRFPSDADLPGMLTQTVRSLGPKDAQVLRRLAAAHKPWSLQGAIAQLGGSPAELMQRIYTLTCYGLVRRVGPPADRQAGRFMVLNLICHALDELRPTSRELPLVVLQQRVPPLVEVCR